VNALDVVAKLFWVVVTVGATVGGFLLVSVNRAYSLLVSCSRDFCSHVLSSVKQKLFV